MQWKHLLHYSAETTLYYSRNNNCRIVDCYEIAIINRNDIPAKFGFCIIYPLIFILDDI